MLPFIVTLTSSFFHFSFISEVTGNRGLGLLVTTVFVVYFLTLTLLAFNIQRAVVVLLSLSILALMFLPVRKNISVISNVQLNSKLFWIERPYFGEHLAIYKADNRVLLSPEKVFLTKDKIYEAYLNTEKGQVYLLYKNNKNDPYISKEINTLEQAM